MSEVIDMAVLRAERSGLETNDNSPPNLGIFTFIDPEYEASVEYAIGRIVACYGCSRFAAISFLRQNIDSAMEWYEAGIPKELLN